MLTVAALFGALASLSAARPVAAAEGDGHAVGVRFDLAADVLGATVIEADAVVGSATAPTTLDTDSENAVDVTLPTAVGVSASGTVDEVTVTRRPYYTTASSTVSDVAVDVLGVPALAVAGATASVSCGLDLQGAAETTLDGLTVFGAAVTLPADGAPVTSSRSLPVTGLTDARLTATVTRTETRDVGARVATAVAATFEITGDTTGGPVTVPAGTVTVAEAGCERPPRPPRPVPPVVTGLEPAAGPQSGGNQFTVTGDNFYYGYLFVWFDSQRVTDVTIGPDGTTLHGTVPPGDPGPATLSIYTLGGTFREILYTYLVDGSESYTGSVRPDEGPATGGATVTIGGGRLQTVQAVTFDGVPGTDLSISPDGGLITVRTPPRPPGPAQVELVFPAGTRTVSSYDYAVPAVTGIVPAVGPTISPTFVEITGPGLATTTEVRFGGVPGTGLRVDWAFDRLFVLTPPGLVGPVDIELVMTGPDLVVPGGFTYSGGGGTAPRIDSVNPGEGTTAGGTTATVSGANFVPDQTHVTICGQTLGPAVVTVGGAFNVLTFPTPSCAAGTTTLTVRTPAGTSNEVTFRYVGEGPPVTGEPGDAEPGDGGSDDGGSDDGLPVTGRALGPVAASGVLAVLLGAALRLATGQRTGLGRRRRDQR